MSKPAKTSQRQAIQKLIGCYAEMLGVDRAKVLQLLKRSGKKDVKLWERFQGVRRIESNPMPLKDLRAAA